MSRYKSTDPYEFWLNRDWPDDRYGFVFLGRALLAVGATLWADAWEGQEPLSVLNPPQHRPLPRLPAPHGSSLLSLPAQESSEPWWTTPLLEGLQFPQMSDEERQRDGDRRARWADVVRAAAQFLHQGILVSATRPLGGGDMQSARKEAWNTELDRNFVRFLLCRVDPDAPFNGDPAGPFWIYVTGASLSDLLERLARAREHRDAPAVAENVSLEDGTGQQLESPAAGKSQPVAFRKALRALIEASPNQKTMTKDQVTNWAKSEFGLGPAQARDGRKFVLDTLAEQQFSHVWGRPGAPKK